MEVSITGKSYFLNKFEGNEDEIFDFGSPQNYSIDEEENIDMIFSIAQKIKDTSNLDADDESKLKEAIENWKSTASFK